MTDLNVYEVLIACYSSLQVGITLAVMVWAGRSILEAWSINGKILTKWKLFKLWVKTVWKMRSVYSSVVVHTFDIITDLFVIAQWYQAEPNGEDKVDHIDSTLMASCAVGVFVFHKVVSSFAIYISNHRNWKYGIAQLFDLLLFWETYQTHKGLAETLVANNNIFISHVPTGTHAGQHLQSVSVNTRAKPRAVISTVTSRSPHEGKESVGPHSGGSTSGLKVDINNDAIDASLMFVYLRCLEAIFESTPQSVLQLVYILRTSDFDTLVLISIIQSFLSLTNSMLKSDNAYMTHSKWKKSKRRFPIPSFSFLKHALFRLFEISSRIGVLAAFWVVVGGYSFTVLLGVEMLFPVMYNVYLYFLDKESWTEFFLSLNIFTVLPPEWIFESREIPVQTIMNLFLICWVKSVSLTVAFYTWGHDACESALNGIASEDSEGAALCCCCCCIPLTILIILFLIVVIIMIICVLVMFAITIVIGVFCVLTIIFLYIMPPVLKNECYIYANMRMWVTLIETSIIIIYGLFVEYQDGNYLFGSDYSLSAFIAILSFFLLYLLLYTYLMPDIRLPDNINIRSKFGYAYLGNVRELTRLWDQFTATLDNFSIEKEEQEQVEAKYTQFDALYQGLIVDRDELEKAIQNYTKFMFTQAEAEKQREEIKEQLENERTRIITKYAKISQAPETTEKYCSTGKVLDTRQNQMTNGIRTSNEIEIVYENKNETETKKQNEKRNENTRNDTSGCKIFGCCCCGTTVDTRDGVAAKVEVVKRDVQQRELTEKIELETAENSHRLLHKEIEKRLKKSQAMKRFYETAKQECIQKLQELKKIVQTLGTISDKYKEYSKLEFFLFQQLKTMWPQKCIEYAKQNEQWYTVEWLKQRGAVYEIPK